jgi:hypothetical protein
LSLIGDRSRRGGVLDLRLGERSLLPGCQLSLAGGVFALSRSPARYVSALIIGDLARKGDLGRAVGLYDSPPPILVTSPSPLN